MNTTLFEYPIDVAWGHCDPAGIIFYPHYFRWFDDTFHAFLKSRDLDQRILAEKLGTMGTGLIDARANFKSPITYGDRLVLALEFEAWENKTFSVGYTGRCGERTVVTGYEVRGLFMREAKTGTVRAAPIAPLRALLES